MNEKTGLLVLVALAISGLILSMGVLIGRTTDDSPGCPPVINAAVRVRLFYTEPYPESRLTEEDRAFMKACGFGDFSPSETPPPEGGGT